MSNVKESDGMSKRQFMRYCLFGAGCCFLGIDRITSLAEGAAAKPGNESPTADLWKWSKEALFYHNTPDGLQCDKCPHGCLLGLQEVGICRNRINDGGKLYTIAYGNPCAVHIDPIEKKPLFHFLPSTRAFSIAVAGCNLRCLNCQNWQISQFSPKETENYDMMPESVVENCLRNQCESIAYTYSEPTTFYEYALDTAKLARAKGIKNVWKSSGYINEAPLRKLCKYIDAANIDLKVFDDVVYRTLNGATLDPVLRTLKIFKQEGVWLEITNLVIPTWTDKIDVIGRMCEWLNRNGLADCPLHFDRFTPLYKLNQLPSTPVSTLEEARDIAQKAGTQYAYIGNVPGHLGENTFCHNCKRMIVERKGFTIVKNLIEKNKCTFCGVSIPGVWQTPF